MPANNLHQDICKKLDKELERFLHLGKWVVQRSTTLWVRGEEGPCPDVVAVLHGRWLQGIHSPSGYTEGVPELVIEVRSSAEESGGGEKEEKRKRIYLSDPRCQAFWIVTHKSQSVEVFTSIGTKSKVYEDFVPIPERIAKGEVVIRKFLK